MSKQKETSQKVSDQVEADGAKPREKRDWETPAMEDVSEQVMAQPYIRFT